MIRLKGYVLKDGVIKVDEKKFDRSKQLRRKPGGSKKVRVKRRGAP